MALLIADECIACDACREECPNEAIERTTQSILLTLTVVQSVLDTMMSHNVLLFVLSTVLVLTLTM